MFSLFRALTERLKAMFTASAALEFEAEFVARDAERRAELLRRAERYAKEGLHGIAQHLRDQAETLSVERPLASALPAVAHLQIGFTDGSDAPRADSKPVPGTGQPQLSIHVIRPKRRGGKS